MNYCTSIFRRYLGCEVLELSTFLDYDEESGSIVDVRKYLILYHCEPCITNFLSCFIAFC